MKNKLEKIARNFFVVGLIGIALLLLISLDDIFSNKPKSTIDLNNFSIEGLTEDQIVNEKKFISHRSSKKYTSGTKTGAGSATKYEDSDKVVFSCKKITGIKLVSATKASDCNLKLSISSNLVSGNAKIVVICDKEIVEYVDFNTEKNLIYEVSGEHTYEVKLLCEDAELEIDVRRAFE